MRVYDQERRDWYQIERALRLVFEALTAISVVACVIALANTHVIWTLILAAVAWGCFEAAAALDES